MIQTFSADRTDHALDVCALPWRARGAKNLLDIQDFDLLAELLSVDPITISQQIFRCGVERKGFEHLLRSPFRSRMGSHVVPKSLTSLGRRCSSMCVVTIGEAWPLVCCGVGSV